MKNLFFLLFASLIFTQYASSQEFKFKNEIEISPNFGISKHSFFIGSTNTYRRFITDKVTVYGLLGFNHFGVRGVGLEIQNIDNLVFGVGANYFFQNSHNGFYLNTNISLGQYLSPPAYINSDDWSFNLGLGYKMPLSKKLFISAEGNINYSTLSRQLQFAPKLGIGIKF